jgi:hypothetical protein
MAASLVNNPIAARQARTRTANSDLRMPSC